MMLMSIFILFVLSQAVLAAPNKHTPEYLDFLRASGQDEEFARALGIPDVSLVRANEETRSENWAVSELGDILLIAEQKEQARQGINFQRYPGNKWVGNVIPYWISTNANDYTATQRQYIEDAIRALNNSLTNLKLRRYQSGDQDYVVVFSGNGCYSNLGKTGGQQSISLQSNGCLSTGTIQHEFIHASGFVHEHMRPDRDNYITILWDNIPQEWRNQYDKVSGTDFGLQGPYEYYSVMHYPVNAPGTNKPAFEVLDKTIQQQYIGQRYGVTQNDVNKVNTLYQ